MPETAPLAPLEIFNLMLIVARARADLVHDYYVRSPSLFAPELEKIDESLALLESRIGFPAVTRFVPRHRSLVPVVSHA